MYCSIETSILTQYVVTQVNNMFPDNNLLKVEQIKPSVSDALDRIEKNFTAIPLPYYNKNNQPYFNHLHGDHYAAFLYLLSNSLYKSKADEWIATKVFLLNKALHGIDAYYGIHLPEHFLFVHPIGTILGNASYSDYLVVYQGVTVGATIAGIYPTLGKKLILYSNSSVIGDCKIANDVILGAKASIINTHIQEKSCVVGSFPSHKIIPNRNEIINKYFTTNEGNA